MYSHDLYFDLMAPPGQEIAPAILEYYDTGRQFFSDMKTAALGQFGSGCAWLVISPDGSPAVMPLDVWEHAYYLKYHNLRSSYIDNWFHIINWEAVSERLLSFFLP